MRIAQVVHSFPPYTMAGTEIYTYNLCSQLAKKHKVYIFHRICDTKKKEYDLIRIDFDGIKTYAINNTFKYCDSFEKFYRNDAIAKRFGKFLDEVKPDVVHIQHLIYLSTTIIEEIKKRNLPIVFTLHDYWLVCPQWHFLKKGISPCDSQNISECVDCLKYQLSIRKTPKRFYCLFRNKIPKFLLSICKRTYLYCSDLLFFSHRIAKKQIIARAQHIREMCKQVDIFISPSRFLINKFIDFGIPGNKIKFLPFGLNGYPFRNISRIQLEKVRFGFIGTLLPAKGVHVLIDAFNRIEDDEAELKIYGRLYPYNGFEYYPKYLKRIIKNKKIYFMGEFNNKDIANILPEIDVLVVPSIWYENFPFVIHEAFLAKIPVVASNIGGIPELIQDGENGLLFPANDAKELFLKLKKLIEGPRLIEYFRSNIKQPKSIKKNGEEIENIYENLLSRK